MMTPSHHNQQGILILVLGPLTAIGPFSIDMYLPGFSAIARDLHTSHQSSLLYRGVWPWLSAQESGARR
jgi:hypothetical protein